MATFFCGVGTRALLNINKPQLPWTLEVLFFHPTPSCGVSGESHISGFPHSQTKDMNTCCTASLWWLNTTIFVRGLVQWWAQGRAFLKPSSCHSFWIDTMNTAYKWHEEGSLFGGNLDLVDNLISPTQSFAHVSNFDSAHSFSGSPRGQVLYLSLSGSLVSGYSVYFRWQVLHLIKFSISESSPSSGADAIWSSIV